MTSRVTEIKDMDIKDISANLSTENKKYVIAVANALLFSQSRLDQPLNKENQGKRDNQSVIQ